MTSVKKVALATALAMAMGGVGLSPAKAVTWNFNSPTGALGTTQNYSSIPGGLTATAAGFLSGAANPNGAFGTPGNLFGKNDAGDEKGVGMQSPLGGTDNEITAGVSFIRIALPSGLTGATATMNSVTGNEHFEIFGSTSATSGYSLVVANGNDELPHLLQTPGCATCTFFAFFAVGVQSATDFDAANVLVNSITAEASVVPLPGALPLFATGMGLLGLLGWRKKRKNALAA
jgi:hypothetical protein